MNINRLNYENYFLLYVDGELSAAEMQAVESFAAENEDLADELDTLLQTKLPTESNYLFDNKSTLFRTASHHINSINYEEKFLLFVDEELSEQEKIETLDFVAIHPQYQAAFDIIKQTKLPAETISFPDKDSLLRKEEDRKPVIIMQWWKIAVAAALIGIIILVGIFIPFNHPANELVKTKINTNPVPNTIPSKKQTIVTINKNIEQSVLAQQNKPVNKSSVIEPTLKNIPAQPIVSEKLIAKTEITKQKLEQVTIVQNASNNILATNDHTIGIELNAHADQISAVNNRIQTMEDTNYAKPTVYKELDTDDERKSLYLGSVEINKDKLRGFLRKASSLFKVKNKTEEEKIEISNSHSLE